jgi:hypothetical protein
MPWTYLSNDVNRQHATESAEVRAAKTNTPCDRVNSQTDEADACSCDLTADYADVDDSRSVRFCSRIDHLSLMYLMYRIDNDHMEYSSEETLEE